jgi:hypothetical protein
MKMKHICSGCGKLLGYIETPTIAGLENAVSHGICKPCAIKIYGTELVVEMGI